MQSLYPNGSVSVFNANRYGSPGPEGKSHSISGYAVIPNPKVAAKLEVHLDGVPFPAPCVWTAPCVVGAAGSPSPFW